MKMEWIRTRKARVLSVIVSIIVAIMWYFADAKAGDLWNNKNCPECEQCEVCEPCDECPTPPTCPRCPSLKCPDIPDCICPGSQQCPDCVCPDPCPLPQSVSGSYRMFGMGLTEEQPNISIGIGSVSISKDGSCGLMEVCTTSGGCTGYVLKRTRAAVK